MTALTITQDEANNIAEAVTAASWNDCDVLLNYSGRGMYGAACVGFVTDRATDITAAIVDVFQQMDEDADEDSVLDKNELSDIIRDARTDDMGLKTVVYFPNMTVVA